MFGNHLRPLLCLSGYQLSWSLYRLERPLVEPTKVGAEIAST